MWDKYAIWVFVLATVDIMLASAVTIHAVLWKRDSRAVIGWLIDKIDSDRAAGAEPYAAVVGAALSRFRPILMTTVTTVFGLLPLIISLDPLFFSMAVILAFGLMFGTILTLGVVPALYAVLFRVKAG